MGPDARHRRWLAGCALLVSFTAIALAVLGPALRGAFVSDDYLYLNGNPFVQRMDAASLRAIVDPASEATRFTQNWAPLVLLVHGAAWQLFGPAPLGHHVLNVVLHAIASSLLVLLLVRATIPPLVSIALGLVFLLHPANVEAVAWASQLKSVLSLALALLALVWHPRRPALALLAFVAALLAKASALFALPMAAVLAWARTGRGEAARAGWLAGWTIVAGAHVAIELGANLHTNLAPAIHDDALVRARTLVALVGRYAAIALTGNGTSVFHEPAPVLRFGDPWLGLGALVIAAAGARTVVALRQRREEAAWWIGAAAAFAPVSQWLVPFLYPMADRYLYFVLPGLMGGLALALRPRAGSARAARLPARAPELVALALAGLALVFGVRAHERAAVFRSASSLLADAIRHYPDGTSARMERARMAAQRGDGAATARELRGVRPFALEMNALLSDPAIRGVAGHSEMRALLAEIGARWIAFASALEAPTQREMRELALAHLLRGETAQARAALERGITLGGPRTEELRRELAALPAGRAERAPDAAAEREPAEPRVRSEPAAP